MNLQELIAHISTWGEGQGKVLSQDSGQPEEQYRNILEREVLKKGKVLLKRYQDLQEKLRSFEAEKVVLKTQLQDFERETKQMVDLPTGDQVMVDVSNRPRIQEFWKEVRGVIHEAPVLAPIDFENLIVHTPASESLYDPAFLPQESDDLLRYL